MCWHWVACLGVASDNGGKLPLAADLAFALRMTGQRAAVLVTELHRADCSIRSMLALPHTIGKSANTDLTAQRNG
jgi:hypothetical protein